MAEKPLTRRDKIICLAIVLAYITIFSIVGLIVLGILPPQ